MRSPSTLPSLVDESVGTPRSGEATPARKAPRGDLIKLVVAAVLLAGAAVLFFRSFSTGVDSNELSRTRVVIDSKTNEIFERFVIPEGSNAPYVNPKTGTRTLYFAEPCYWTKEGGATYKPTYVLVKSYLGEPGDTFCPDCGRKVVAHNPAPPRHLFPKQGGEEK